MFNKKPLLVKDLPLNTIKAVMECYHQLSDESELIQVFHKIAIEYRKVADEIEALKENKEKFESALSDKYIKLERKLRNDLAEEESGIMKSFNVREEKKDEEIYQLKIKIVNLNQDLGLIKKENAILEQKMDDQDELVAEISELKAIVAALTAENNEKDSKFNLLLDIYENPKIQETRIFEPTIVEPRIIEPRMIPTVSCNQKQHDN